MEDDASNNINNINNHDVSFYINRIYELERECNDLEIEHNNNILDLETSHSSEIVELNKKIKDEVDNSKSKEKMRKSQIADLESNIIKNKNLIKDLKEQDNKKTKEILSLKEEISRLKEEICLLKEQDNKKSKEIDFLKEQDNKKSKEIDSLKEEFSNLKLEAIKNKKDMESNYHKIINRIEKKELESLVRLTDLSLFFLEKILYPKICTYKGQKVTWDQFRLSFTTNEDYKTTSFEDYGVNLEKLKELIDERNDLVHQAKIDIKKSVREMAALSHLLPDKYIEFSHQIIDASNNYIYK
ncbi:hypothetical protein ACTFIZ_008566 [Dictyostelium cf. discoideum]